MEIIGVPQILRHHLATPPTSFGPLTRMSAILDNNPWTTVFYDSHRGRVGTWILVDDGNCIIDLIWAYRWKKKRYILYTHCHQQLQGYTNIYKLSFSQSASQGCCTWQTLHTFIFHICSLWRNDTPAVTGFRSLTQGHIDSPAPPSSITQNKWRSISSAINT